MRAQELLDFSQRLGGRFLRDEVAAVEGFSAHVLRDLTPICEAVELLADHAAGAPENVHRHVDLAAPVCPVMRQVDVACLEKAFKPFALRPLPHRMLNGTTGANIRSGNGAGWSIRNQC